jgi:hypothetical protein
MAAKKVVVILDEPKKWREWLETLKSIAVAGEVWDLIDPTIWSGPTEEATAGLTTPRSLDTEAAQSAAAVQRTGTAQSTEARTAPSTTTRPAYRPRLRYTTGKSLVPKPELPEAWDVNPESQSLAELTDLEERDYKHLKAKYRVEYEEYNRRASVLQQIHTRLFETVDQRYHEWLYDNNNVRDMLASLQKRVKPDEYNRKNDIRKHWDELRQGQKNMSMEQWLDSMVSTYKQGEKMKLEFTYDNRGTEEFLVGLPAGGYRETLIGKFLDQVNSNQKVMTLYEAIERYRHYYNNFMTKAPKRSTGSAFATFNGQSPDNSNEDNENQQTGDTHRKHSKADCPCGEKHKFNNCPYICSSVRPKGWKRDEDVWQRMQERFQEKPTLKAAADRVAEQDKKKSAESGKAEAKKGTQNESQDAKKKGSDNVVMTTMFHGLIPSDDEDDDAADHVFLTEDQYAPNPLEESFILDSGATIHVCNNRERFFEYKEADEDSRIVIGDTHTHVVGWGKVKLYAAPVTGSERVEIILQNVAYIPRFGCNIVSFRVIMKQGFIWHTKRGIIMRERKPICRVEEHHNMYTMEYNHVNMVQQVHTAMRKTKKRSYVRAESQATAEIWHQRMGHANYEAIQHLPDSTEGVKLLEHPDDEDTLRRCEACRLSKPVKQISRVPTERAWRPWEKVHFDLIKAETAYNDSTQILHFYCDATRSHRVVDLKYQKDDDLNDLKEAIYQFLAWVHTQFGYKVKILQSDQDRALGKDFVLTLKDNGTEWHTSVAYAKEQNGGSERSGRMLIEESRTFHVDSKIPKNLWPQTYHCAAYLLNRTPNRALDWTTPYEVIRERTGKPGKKPYIGHLKIFGSRVYEMIPTELIKRKDKMAPRALIGYLVGYEGTNQFWVWNPRNGTVNKKRDVTFDEKIRYDPKDPYIEDIIVNAVPRLTTVVDISVDQPELRTHVFNDSETEDSEREEALNENSAQESTNQEPRTDVILEREKEATPTDSPAGPYMTPERTPSEAAEQPGDPETPQQATEAIDEDEHEVIPTPIEHPTAPRDINANLTTNHIVRGSRKRTQKRDRDFIYQTRLENPDQEDIFYAMIIDGTLHRGDKRIHQSSLPPEPKNWKQAMRHPMRDCWKKAAVFELESLKDQSTFSETEIPKGKQVILTKWVFKYKFDSEGYLVKLKARLCVRGDLQIQGRDDTYAATLAAKSFRALMAICAIFNLDAYQHDAINAFVNSLLDEEVYVHMPDGYEMPGRCWRLLKALYGLRRSPRLWQLEFGSWLRSMGFKQVPEDPCVYTTEHIIVIFFVDDIVTLSYPANRSRVRDFEDSLHAKYPMRNVGELRWFLGIRVIRDRNARKLWLCQDSYIDKIVSRFHLEQGKRPPIPLVYGQPLTPNEGKATPETVHQYQAKVGSALYPTIITRPDCAFAASKLAEHLQNPSQQHADAADRAIKYLDGTKTLAIEYSVENMKDTVMFATDAAYADNPDRKSSEGYVMKMFGGVVDWKAGKQKTVTTSTTEAELLSLSNGAREVYWWIRFFKAIRLDPEQDIEIWCDNSQTVGLLTKIDPELKTRLRHVDIHHHWLRQEVSAGNVNITWKPTNEMPADGLTKALSIQKHQEFVKMLGLKDIGDMILAS